MFAALTNWGNLQCLFRPVSRLGELTTFPISTPHLLDVFGASTRCFSTNYYKRQLWLQWKVCMTPAELTTEYKLPIRTKTCKCANYKQINNAANIAGQILSGFISSQRRCLVTLKILKALLPWQQFHCCRVNSLVYIFITSANLHVTVIGLQHQHSVLYSNWNTELKYISCILFSCILYFVNLTKVICILQLKYNLHVFYVFEIHFHVSNTFLC